jgi:hypothetical protein
MVGKRHTFSNHYLERGWGKEQGRPAKIDKSFREE